MDALFFLVLVFLVFYFVDSFLAYEKSKKKSPFVSYQTYMVFVPHDMTLLFISFCNEIGQPVPSESYPYRFSDLYYLSMTEEQFAKAEILFHK